ncbi:hypothetical protein [Vibrio superstes]|uniref:Uncharacterized protein n=1 Tax=Vibrio superstes NBRC 103154 TaxID=1219062 RepID=A0A511QV10_9VIBR|nr:hypothetical protein [Vibrio superstes]GEM81205.1 hypothetical protein VSU01S_34500 [Vibrio superstes NBRC 103154]
MYKSLLVLLMISSSYAHAAIQDDANSALLENISRFNQYEQTATEMSQGQTNIVPASAQQNQMVQATPQVVTTPTRVSPNPSQVGQTTTGSSSVYESVKILISSGTLSDKEKIKLISMLSS